MLVEDLFETQLKNQPDKTFIKANQASYSFLDVWQKIQRVASSFKKANFVSGSRVLICYWNEPDFVFSYFGVLLANGIPVTITPLLTMSERQAIYKHSAGCLWLGEGGRTLNDFCQNPDSLGPPYLVRAEYHPAKSGVIIYTSGTTGDPKGVMLTEENIRSQIELASQAIGLTEADRLLSTLSFSHVFGQMDLLWSALFAGSTLTLLPRFEAKETLNLLVEDQITALIAVPTMYKLLIRQLSPISQKLPALRLCHTGAAPLTSDLFCRIEQVFGLIPQQGYGLTETCSMAFSNPLSGLRKDRSVGLPLPGLQVKILGESGLEVPVGQIGEVILSGSIISPGYFANSQATVAAGLDRGWLKTGDLGYRDSEGYLYLVDRCKDMIIHAGFKVYPSEIEEIIRLCDGVAEVIVIGLESELRSQRIKALVELEAEYLDRAASVRLDIQSRCRDQLAVYKRPHQIEFVKEIPKTPSGKLLRRC